MKQTEEPSFAATSERGSFIANKSGKSNIVCDNFVNILAILFSCSVDTIIIQLPI